MESNTTRKLAAAAVAVTLAFFAGGKVKAFDPQPDPPALAALSLTAREGIRVNLSNIRAPRCSAEVRVYNAAGVMVGDPHVFVLAPKISFSLLLPAQPSTASALTHLRPELRTEPDGCATGLVELYDLATLRTIAVYPGTPQR